MPNLVGHQYADEYIPADYSDKEAILKICQENDIWRIISCANDFGVLTSAYVAEKMGWPGHDTYENAMIMPGVARLPSGNIYLIVKHRPFKPMSQIATTTAPTLIARCRVCVFL